MSTRTTRLRRAKVATAAVLALGSPWLLSACGADAGVGLNGTYYVQDVNGTSGLGQLVVDGEELIHHEYKCEGVYDEPDVTSVGELNADRSQVNWTIAGQDSRNERKGTEALTIGDSSISIGGDVYVREDSVAGEELLNAFESDCAD